MLCPDCGKEMHWHGEPIGGYLCDDCHEHILDYHLRG